MESDVDRISVSVHSPAESRFCSAPLAAAAAAAYVYRPKVTTVNRADDVHGNEAKMFQNSLKLRCQM